MDLHLHHPEEHLQSSDFLRDIVLGMSDGLTVPFALAAGLSGAVDSTAIIIIAGIGLSKELQDKATEEIALDKDKWVKFMMKYELGLDAPDPRRAAKSAFNIGTSYIVGGLVPLSPYFFVTHPIEGLKYSVIVTLICLFVFGWFKNKITG